MTCPVCKRCPFVKGVCEDRVNRGRRFFLMGALALPVARKLEALAPIVEPVYTDVATILSYSHTEKTWRFETLERTLAGQGIGATKELFKWEANTRVWRRVAPNGVEA